MLKIVTFLIGSTFTMIGVFLLIFIYTNFNATIYDNMKSNKHRLILIILDAFRHDYLEVAKSRQIELPNLIRMATKGARSMNVEPVYPSVTMTNHQTLVTGLYSPYHGITGNTFNDSSLDYEQFAMSRQTSLNEARWYKGYPDPIWVTCEKTRLCKSGSMLWPNTDAPIDGYRPSRYVSQYFALNEEPNVIYPYDRRVDEMVGWIRNDNIDFGMLYFDEPDATSHRYGPLHEKTLIKLKELDGFIGRLMDKLEESGLLLTTDLLLTGDHGMTEMSEERVIEIDKFVPPHLYKSTYSYPVGIIYPNEGKFNEVFGLYRNASKYIKVFTREEVPKNLHYSENPRRISPIVTVVELGWFVNSSHWSSKITKGSHGYVPQESDMHTTLLAMGPSFKPITINSTHHVDLYSLMTHLLGLQTNPHNGTFARISPILEENARTFRAITDRWSYNRIVFVTYLALIIQVVASLSVVVFMLCYGRRRGSGPRMVARYDPEQSMALIGAE